VLVPSRGEPFYNAQWDRMHYTRQDRPREPQILNKEIPMPSRRRRSRQDLFRSPGRGRSLPKPESPPIISSLSNERAPSTALSIPSPSDDLDGTTGKLLPFRLNHPAAICSRKSQPPAPGLNAVLGCPLPSILAGMNKTEKAKYARRRIMADSISERILDQVIILLGDCDAH
jgi:hypothetical protein